MQSSVLAARTLPDHASTSAYSAGCFADVRSEIALRDEIAHGRIPGPRIKACAGPWMPAFAVPESTALD